MIGSPFSIDGGASTRTLWRRIGYRGRKGRRARLRLRALEKRIAPMVDRWLEQDHARVRALMRPVLDFAQGRMP